MDLYEKPYQRCSIVFFVSCEKIDTSARDMAEYLIKEMAKKQGVTEELKATDMMRWIGLMNNIRACADEIVLNDIVYS